MEGDIAEDESYFHDVVSALEDLMAPEATTILYGGPPKKRPMRLEVFADEQGAITWDDREGLVRLLSDVATWEGYLRSEVRGEQSTNVCIWHVVNGGIFPLKAEHASAVADYQAPLLPTEGESTIPYEVADAPLLGVQVER
jgi:hypothetical protein